MNTDKLKEIIAKFARMDVKNLDLNADFKNDLHLDSIDLFQMVMEVEETFNIKIDNEQLLKIKTVSDAISAAQNAK
ncbi:MAG: acyl carrier protein [Lachnospiraceae bacterium]|nr:acyl carrier protein [Lachnospiraceae bacterium]